ncbi:SgcJ/EcaC family oxidoreductase [Sphingomonadaceae bacterium OTU29LAMAA1]|nr:SgcJ/EcaC family oxidoreductase [Sphingomonadaceae bacterium OTU29LAMAA1]
MSSETGAAMLNTTADKVQRLAERYAAAWNASDMDAMAKLYSDDVHWVNIVGMHWQGKAQVDQAHRAYFDIMFKGVPLMLEAVESAVALPGGAVVAVLRWKVGAFKTPFGEQMPPSRDRMSLVLIPQADELVIAHGSNVQINEQAQHSDPVRQK